MPDRVPNTNADYEHMAAMLSALPAETTVHVTYLHGERTNRLMARDLPHVLGRAQLLSGDGRRFTNLDTGTEWFITPTNLDNLSVTEVRVDPFTITRM